MGVVAHGCACPGSSILDRTRAQRNELIDLPTPRFLACASLAQGYERLTQACRISNAIALGPDGFYYLKITPSTELQSRLLVDFHRLDWCLDTTEFGLM